MQNKEIAERLGVGRVQVSSYQRGERVAALTRQWLGEAPKDKTIHLVADNYATHKHPAVREWLAKHPRFVMHFTPTSARGVHKRAGPRLGNR